ncbi:ABC transporter permease [Lysinibacillus sphaericus]|uniref:Permease n=1 Tax=Lysinibacillus sphaericus OT4b.31 TaxID=1285586 RepID=R7ZJW1_LYSSH|nr:ABC transporter permease [Lysinibacillus sphaericus]EON74309.1 permease [Lysinibacillus sphaericus OT4b.31]
MNFIKRAVLSVKARKGKSLILFAVFLVVANLVLAGFAIQNVSKTANDLARQKLGVDVSLRLDEEKLMQNVAKQREENPGGRIKHPELSAEEADQLAKLSYVEDFNYLKSEMLVADGYTPVNADKGGEAVGGSVGGNNNGSMKMPDTFFQGVRSSDLLKDFKEGTNKIVEGRPITPEDKNKKVVLIEERLAEQNELQVGDKLKIKSTDEVSKVELEIVGIYKNSDITNFEESLPPMMHPSNRVYANYDSMKEFNENDNVNDTTINEAIYYLKDPESIADFKAEGKKTTIDFDLFKLDAHDALYQKMVGPIENIASTSKWIVYLVSISGSIILGLIIMLTIKERRKELGILLAIGEKKRKLVGQLLVEVLCVAVLAFGISIITGETVSQKMGDSLLQKEVIASEEQQQESNNLGFSFGMMNGQDKNKDVDPIDNIDVSISSQDVLNLGGLGLLIVVLSTLLPALSILRLNPKEILLKDE